MIHSQSTLRRVTQIALLNKRIQTRDSLLTFDQQTLDSTGAFLIGELERLDQTLHMPLVSYTWSRDIDLREDVSMADELSSFTNSMFSAAPGVAGSGKAWVGKDANAITGISVDIGKTASPLILWAMQLGWTIPELESAQKLGRPVDSQKWEGMQIKYNMDIDEQVYIGDAGLGVTGLLNSSRVTNVTNVANGDWDNPATTADEILADVNEILYSAWQQAAYAVCPGRLLVPPKEFGVLVSRKVSDAGNLSILEYVRTNCIANRINGRPLDILPLKWLTGTTDGNPNGPGTAGANRMVAYTKDRTRVRFPLVPLQRTPLEYRDIRQLVTYFGRLGVVEVVYPETIAYRDGI